MFKMHERLSCPLCLVRKDCRSQAMYSSALSTLGTLNLPSLYLFLTQLCSEAISTEGSSANPALPSTQSLSIDFLEDSQLISSLSSSHIRTWIVSVFSLLLDPSLRGTISRNFFVGLDSDVDPLFSDRISSLVDKSLVSGAIATLFVDFNEAVIEVLPKSLLTAASQGFVDPNVRISIISFICGFIYAYRVCGHITDTQRFSLNSIHVPHRLREFAILDIYRFEHEFSVSLSATLTFTRLIPDLDISLFSKWFSRDQVLRSVLEVNHTSDNASDSHDRIFLATHPQPNANDNKLSPLSDIRMGRRLRKLLREVFQVGPYIVASTPSSGLDCDIVDDTSDFDDSNDYLDQILDSVSGMEREGDICDCKEPRAPAGPHHTLGPFSNTCVNSPDGSPSYGHVSGSRGPSPSPASLNAPLVDMYFDLSSRTCDEVISTFTLLTDGHGFISEDGLKQGFLRYLKPSFRGENTESANSLNDFIHPDHVDSVSALLSRLFHFFDADNSGSIDFTELVAGLSRFCGASDEERIKSAFEVLDYNVDGSISQEELVLYLKSIFLLVMAGGTDASDMRPKPGDADDENEKSSRNSTSSNSKGPLNRGVNMTDPASVRQYAHELAVSTASEAFLSADANGDGFISFDEFKEWFILPPQRVETAAARHTILKAATVSSLPRHTHAHQFGLSATGNTHFSIRSGEVNRNSHSSSVSSASANLSHTYTHPHPRTHSSCASAEDDVNGHVAPLIQKSVSNTSSSAVIDTPGVDSQTPHLMQQQQQQQQQYGQFVNKTTVVTESPQNSGAPESLSDQLSYSTLSSFLGIDSLPLAVVLGHFASYATTVNPFTVDVPLECPIPDESTRSMHSEAPGDRLIASDLRKNRDHTASSDVKGDSTTAPPVSSATEITRELVDASDSEKKSSQKSSFERKGRLVLTRGSFNAAVATLLDFVEVTQNSASFTSSNATKKNSRSSRANSNEKAVNPTDFRSILSRLFDIFDTDGSKEVDFAELIAGLSLFCAPSELIYKYSPPRSESPLPVVGAPHPSSGASPSMQLGDSKLVTNDRLLIDHFHVTTPYHEDPILTAFKLFDIHGTGTISFAAMHQFLTAVLKVAMTSDLAGYVSSVKRKSQTQFHTVLSSTSSSNNNNHNNNNSSSSDLAYSTTVAVFADAGVAESEGITYSDFRKWLSADHSSEFLAARVLVVQSLFQAVAALPGAPQAKSEKTPKEKPNLKSSTKKNSAVPPHQSHHPIIQPPLPSSDPVVITTSTSVSVRGSASGGGSVAGSLSDSSVRRSCQGSAVGFQASVPPNTVFKAASPPLPPAAPTPPASSGDNTPRKTSSASNTNRKQSSASTSSAASKKGSGSYFGAPHINTATSRDYIGSHTGNHGANGSNGVNGKEKSRDGQAISTSLPHNVSGSKEFSFNPSRAVDFTPSSSASSSAAAAAAAAASSTIPGSLPTPVSFAMHMTPSSSNAPMNMVPLPMNMGMGMGYPIGMHMNMPVSYAPVSVGLPLNMPMNSMNMTVPVQMVHGQAPLPSSPPGSSTTPAGNVGSTTNVTPKNTSSLAAPPHGGNANMGNASPVAMPLQVPVMNGMTMGVHTGMNGMPVLYGPGYNMPMPNYVMYSATSPSISGPAASNSGIGGGYSKNSKKEGKNAHPPLPPTPSSSS